jgi:hypothetical protein
MRNPAIFAAAVLATASLPSNHAFALETPHPLTGEEVQALLTGNTLIGWDKEGPFWMYYADGHTVWGRSSSGDVDVGRWWIENHSYCRSWRRWFAGETRCWQFSAVGDDILIWHSLTGEPMGRSTVRRGNAMGDVPGGGSAIGPLVDAGSGLSASLDAVVARAEVEPLGLGAPRDAHGASAVGLPTPPAGPPRRGPVPGPGPQFPPVPNSSASKQSSAAASGATSTARAGGFLDRLGVRSGGAEPDGGGSQGGGNREGKGGTDRD